MTCAAGAELHDSSAVRDLDVIESELRLLAAVRRICVELGGSAPRVGPADELLDELLLTRATVKRSTG